MRFYPVFFYLFLFHAPSISGQLSIWTDTSLVQSHGISLVEKNDSIYFTISNQNTYMLPEGTDYRTHIYSLSTNKADLLHSSINLVADIDNEDNMATQAAYFVEETKRWLFFQTGRTNEPFFTFRISIFDEHYNFISSSTVVANHTPLEYYFDSYGNNTYLMGSALVPGNKIVFLKYDHEQPDVAPEIQITQSSPTSTFYITSMICDQYNGNIILFHYGGIKLLDSTLNIIADHSYFDVFTSDHGHVIQRDSFFFSNGTASQPEWNGLRLMVFQKYSSEFELMNSDSLGRPQWDNFPFINRSLDARNGLYLTGGILDGPNNSFTFYEKKKKFYLAKYDEQMNRIWYKEYGGDKGYLPVGLHLLEDGDALVYGYIVDSLTQNRDAFLMYVDEHGELVSSKEIAVETPFRIHNQPGLPLLIDNTDNIPCILQVFSLNGQCVYEQVLTKGVNEIQGINWPPGVYPFVISSHSRHLHSGKWVKL